MATTDTRSGFRLPWSSDRTPEDPAVEDAAVEAPAVEAPADPAHAAPSSVAWPDTDFESRIGFTAAHQRPTDAPAPAQEAPRMIAEQPAAPPRKPTKLMADLAAAIRATTESARDQRLGQLESEAAGIIDMIRAQSDEGAVALRRHSDEDVAAIRDWAKAEIARIKEESESRIADRKHQLEREVADHAAAIEDRVNDVHSAINGYRSAIDAYFEQLKAEEDPARLATLAEAMPDPPTLEALTDLEGMPIAGAAERRAAQAVVEAEPVAEAEGSEVDPTTETEPTAEATSEADATPETAAYGDASMSVAELAGRLAGIAGDASTAEGAAPAGDEAATDDVPRWTEGETPDGFPEPVAGGDPVDRGAIMAALEAAAEAVVAAEAAAESAETAEAAADVAETAAELMAGRAGQMNEPDPEAQAALSARVDAGGFETESYADRLASLLPGHAEAADGEPRTTQVVVTGLVSVASIASFKRHLGRLAGVSAVAVASGPDGEFIFNVTHRPDASFRDAIPTMPGFAARVVATGDGVVSVTAHDPEAEG